MLKFLSYSLPHLPHTISGTGVADGTIVEACSGTALTLSKPATAAMSSATLTFQAFSHTASASSGSTTVTLASSSLYAAIGQVVTGTGIATGTVVSITAVAGATLTISAATTATISSGTLTFTTGGTLTFSGTTLSLSKPLTATVSSGTLTFQANDGVLTFLPFTQTGSAAPGSTAVTLGSGTSVAVGMHVSGSGVASGTTVNAISGTALTLSTATVGTLFDVPLQFSATTKSLVCTKAKAGYYSDGNMQVG